MGVKTGIVAIMTALIVGVTSCSPKLSPRKYKKGFISEESKKSGICVVLITCHFRVTVSNSVKVMAEIIKRMKIVSTGPRYSKTTFDQIYDMPQKIMESMANT
jgi:hypothetical protein